ncbi:MAG: hypothetical protein U0M12_07385 [Acutalibacteraceae bacterium]|nr:hypothetical protein [Acutalibacteraceae bacterium]
MEDNNSNSIFARLSDFTKDPKFVKTIVIVGLVGIALILLSSLFSGGKADESEKTDNSQVAYVSLTKYENDLEQSLAEIICSINGAGTTKVMLTMDSTVEQVYATNKNMSQNNSNNTTQSDTANNKDISAETTYITVELADGTEQTVLVKEIQPKVRGVLVVCAGGDNSVVKEKIIDAVTKTLDISSSKVSVAGLSQ